MGSKGSKRSAGQVLRDAQTFLALSLWIFGLVAASAWWVVNLLLIVHVPLAGWLGLALQVGLGRRAAARRPALQRAPAHPP